MAKLRTFPPALALPLALLVALVGCGDSGADHPDAALPIDHDGDGFGADVDCNEGDRSIFPGAPEACDGIDNDCDESIDEGWDMDGDGWTTCKGDCRDADPTSYPNAVEVADGVDNDCDDIIDNNTTASDDDGDGYSEDQGDCNDDPTNGGEYINPEAVEVQLNSSGQPEGIDNDCDGMIDEVLPPCPAGPGISDPQDPYSYASSIEACHFTTFAEWDETLEIDRRSRNILTEFGNTYVPLAGPDFIVLSTGIAADADDPGFVPPQSGTQFSNEVSHPDPQPAQGCSDADETVINDYTEVFLRLEVPSNAVAFSFDFNFMSVEFPEFVCTSFDDTFLALLESQAFTGNVSFDAMGNRVSINVGFFDVCAPSLDPACTGNAPLIGTGHENDGGGTGWLTTTAPVFPGEKISLRFVIFDEGDHILDSTVIIDNFRWEIDEFQCPGGGPPPCTIGREQGPRSRFVRAADVAPVILR